MADKKKAPAKKRKTLKVASNTNTPKKKDEFGVGVNVTGRRSKFAKKKVGKKA